MAQARESRNILAQARTQLRQADGLIGTQTATIKGAIDALNAFGETAIIARLLERLVQLHYLVPLHAWTMEHEGDPPANKKDLPIMAVGTVRLLTRAYVVDSGPVAP